MKPFIRTTQKEGFTKLYTKLKIDGKSYFINLGLDVDIKKWESTFDIDENNKLIQAPRRCANYLDKLGYTVKLQQIEARFKDLRSSNQLTIETANEAVRMVVLAEVRAEQEKYEEKMAAAKEKERRNVLRYIDELVRGVEDGSIRKIKGEEYTKNAVKIWKQFHRVFETFYKSNRFEWEDIDKRLADKFCDYLEKKQGYMKSTSERYISLLKTIVGMAYKEGLHSNAAAKDYFVPPTVKEQDKAKEIYLTKEEIQALYDMPLEGLKEQVRDVFVVGCLTAQRFSDYSRIDASCIGTTAKGTKVIRLVQKKTQSTVVIPISDDKLETLLEKYNYEMPNVIDVILNRYIKQICKELSATVPSLNKKEETKLTKAERLMEEKEGRELFERNEKGNVIKPRYELVSSHTARRSAITNMYLSGKYDIPQMMSVSGHKKTEVFMKYIKLSLDERADKVAEASEDGLF